MMASTGREAISVQPKKERSRVNASTQEQHLDKNGEVIVEELFPIVVSTNFVPPTTTSQGILVPRHGEGPKTPSCSCLMCHIPWPQLDLECCKPPRWHIYLTSSGKLYVVYTTSLFYRCLCTCGYSKQLALTDIEDIQTIGKVVSAGRQNWGSKIAPPTEVVMEIKPDKAKEFLPFCYRCCNLPTVMTIYCDEDVSNFVKAVKQQMNTMARE